MTSAVSKPRLQIATRWVYRSLRWGLAFVFLYAGAIKLADPEAFAVIIEAYGLVPDTLLTPLAVALPALEVLAAVGLMLDLRGSLTIIAVLLSIFIAVLGYGLWMGLAVDCGCFGPEDPEARAYAGIRPALYRDFVLAGGVLLLYGWRYVFHLSPADIRMRPFFTRRRKSMKRCSKGFFILVLVVGFVAANWGMVLAADKFEREMEKEAGAVKLVREVQRGDYDVITAAELKEWIDSGKTMVIVDTMPFEASYAKQHVPSAVQFLFPIPDMENWDTSETDGKRMEDYAALLGPDKDMPIVVYCGFVKCTRSHNGAVWARKLGYKNVYRFSGGIYAWLGAGFPVEKAE